MSMDDMHKKMEEQDKAVKDLKEHFDDASFVTIASMANNDEIKAGEAASSMSTNDDVKMFAKHMVDDHTKAGTEMKELAEKKGWHVSEMCDEKHKMALEELKKMTGTDFDKSYVVGQVKDHEDAIALFKLAADNASDADLKEWVKKEIPTFEDHLSMAKKLESKLMATGT
jgi:putative membrane protein